MSVPLPPARILNTTAGAVNGRAFVVAGSATYDSAGRVQPRNTTGPDLVLDLSQFVSNGFAAIQGNLAVTNGTATGWVGLWDEGPFPGTSSINFVASTAIANYTQTVLGSDLRIRFKVSRPVTIFFDILGLILTDKFAQLGPIFQGSQVAGLASPRALQRRKQSPAG